MSPTAEVLVTDSRVVSKPPKFRVPLGLKPSATISKVPPLYEATKGATDGWLIIILTSSAQEAYPKST